MVTWGHGQALNGARPESSSPSLSQADLSLGLVPDHASVIRTRELLKAALALSKDLITREPDAVILGSIGGKKTAERRPEYFAKIAAMRKNRAGGRPKKGE